MTTNNDRKSRVTGKDVAFLMLTDGISAVAAKHAKDGIAPATADNAIDLLGARPDLAATLQAWRDSTFQASDGARGRPAVKVGESRAYRAQQVGDDGDVFIRLPLSLLGAKKGDPVSCTFNADRTVTVTLG